MNKKILLAATLMGSLMAGTAAFAGPGGKHCGMHGKGHGEYSEQFVQKKIERMTAKLGLSAEQSEQVKQLMESGQEAMKANHTEMQEVHKAIRALDPTASDYAANLESLANRQAELVRQMTIAKGQKRQQMAQILTAEQRDKMKAMWQQRKDRKSKD